MSEMLKPFAAAFAVLACAPSVAVAQDGGRTLDAAYIVYAHGIRAGEFTFSFVEDGDTYQATAERRVTGALRVLARDSQDYQYSVEGLVEEGRLQPVHYRHSGGRRGRVVEAEFTPDDIVTTADPPMGMGEPPATQEQKRGALDQLTAIATMVMAQGDVCERTLPVYLDGRSRFDFVMHPDGVVEEDGRAYEGPAYRCRVDYEPIAGFGDPQEPAELTFVFAPTPSGAYAPVTIQMPTDDAGIIRLEARKVFVDGVRLDR
jgi:hypothetical protein